MIIRKHPIREGLHLDFPNGHTYSIVDLGSAKGIIGAGSDVRIMMAATSMAENIGKLYDGMGGRIEGILLPDEKHNWGEPIRAKNYTEVIEEIIRIEHSKGHSPLLA